MRVLERGLWVPLYGLLEAIGLTRVYLSGKRGIKEASLESMMTLGMFFRDSKWELCCLSVG